MKDRPIRVLALAGTLVVLLLSSVLAARPEPALPAEMPASERSRLAAVTATASLATHAAGEPFVARREVFEYLLDHPEFAALMRLLPSAAGCTPYSMTTTACPRIVGRSQWV